MLNNREHWSSRMGFVLAAAGSAIGLGNLWKFPYITWNNNGGAFVLVYLICILLVGLPIMVSEILIGRKSQKSAVGAMKEAIGPKWGFVGGWGVFTGFIILGYYSVVAGWTINYFIKCVGWSMNGFPAQADMGGAFNGFIANGTQQVIFTAIFTGATMAVVFRGVSKGIERITKILMPALGVILLLLVVSALSMDGAGEALSFIFRPNFSELEPSGILEALGHAFFTLSLGMGAMITYGSYMSKKQSVASAAGLVVLLDTVIAVVATVIMFSVIFSVPGMSDEVGKSTAGMLFITLPQLFYTAVPMGEILAPLFFILVGFAALTSTISLLEVVVAYFIDQKGWARSKATLCCGGIVFVVSVLCALSFGASDSLTSFEVFPGKAGLFSTLDHLASNWLLPIGGLMITIAVGWFMTKDISKAELLEDNTPAWFSYSVWRFTIRFVAPIAVAAIIAAVMFFGVDFS